MRSIWSVGHSNHRIEDFIAMLQSFGITTVADIRTLPASRYSPQFNRASLAAALEQAGIRYLHMPQLGGKREGGFLRYMASMAFERAMSQLEGLAAEGRTTYMCAEAEWRNCHRSHISTFLHKRNWDVNHIKNIDSSEPNVLLLRQARLFH
ncbi:MAG: DUF488 domain-containing protein [Flavipsychrobacter sp.]|nr:DUF488 domain-containing protein [Flavipsychrobacter sp.]